MQVAVQTKLFVEMLELNVRRERGVVRVVQIHVLPRVFGDHSEQVDTVDSERKLVGTEASGDAAERPLCACVYVCVRVHV